MPLFTAHYNLGIKLANEQYSASLDRARFLTIDNEMAFLCDIIGDGRIDGWHLNQQGNYALRVGSGIGLIDRFATRTFGPIDVALSTDGEWFLWMQRKLNTIGGFSDFSSPVSFTHIDTTPPNIPTNLHVIATARDSITLDWTASTSTDISKYNIYRTTDNISGWATATTPVGSVKVTAFQDTGLAGSTQYYYRVKAVDSSGNESSAYATTSAMTLADMRKPSPPRSITVTAGNAFLQVVWLFSPDSFVTGYTVTLQKLLPTGGNDGAPVVANVSATTRQYLFSSLINNINYQITVCSKQVNGVLSDGISNISTPTFSTAPAEVTGISVSNTWDGQAITLHTSWTPNGSFTLPSYYILTLTENGLASQAYTVAGTTKAISVFNGGKLKENAQYTVLVQGVDANSVRNVGVTATFTTNKFSLPAPVTGLSSTLFDNNQLRIDWTNPSSDFSYITVSLSRTDLVSNITTSLFTDVNVSRATYYTFSTYTVELSSLYTFSVKSVDVVGNTSTPTVTTLNIDADVPVPPVPTTLTADATLGSMIIRWTAAEVGNVVGYKIYRASAQSDLMPADFLLLDTVDAETLEMLDYDVQDNASYAYIVTTLDSWGNESHGPGDNTPISDIAFGTMHGTPTLDKPVNVVGSLTGSDFTLTWDAASEFFDGWQVYRAIGNLAFSLIGSVSRGVTTFTDSNINIISGLAYSYIVRKYLNEGTVIAGRSPQQPVNSISLGTAVVSGGTVVSNESRVIEIKDIAAPVIAATQAAIRAHKHQYYLDTDDRRIYLNNNVVVADWVTEDNHIFITSTAIGGDDLLTVPFTIFVDGIQTDLLYELDRVNGQLTFEEQIPPDSVVSVVFENVEEVQGILPPEKIAYFNASNITKDKLDIRTLPPLNHEGRMGERLTPVTKNYKTADFQFYNTDGTDFFGPVGVNGLYNSVITTRTFYDIISAEGLLLAATSNGICTSDDFGHTWTRVLETVRAATRVIPVSTGYVAAVGNTVLFASSLLTDWHSYDGLAGVRVVRDLVQTPDNRLYATTDVGMFMFDPAIVEPYWVQCGQPDYSSTAFYAAMYDSGLAALIVSGDGGLFFSTDHGGTWTLWSAFIDQRPVFNMFRSENALFALAGDRLYRKLDTDSRFSPVALFQHRCRKVVIFKGRLYVGTEDGPYLSSGDIYADASLSFVPALPQLGEGVNRYVMTTLNVIGDRLLLGTENELYASVTHGSASKQYHQTGTFAPSVYVNGVLRTLGVFTTFQTVTFDERLHPTDVVSVANQYLVYQTQFGGWADIAYDAPVTVLYNLTPMNQASATRVPSSVDLTTVVFPALTNRNSDFTAASQSLLVAQASLAAAQLSQTPDKIARLLSALTDLESDCDPSVTIPRFPVQVNLFNGTASVGSADTVTGQFTFTTDIIVGGQLVGIAGDIYRFSKYSDLRVNIGGVTLLNEGQLTHDQIDDQIEQRLSGIDANFARIQQINLVKSGLFIERTWPGERVTNSPPLQMELFGGCARDWYDKFNSTVDYALRIRKTPLNVSIVYPSCVLDVPSRGEVWVGGYGGIIAIEKATIETDATITNVMAAPNQFARCLLMNDDGNVYAVVNDIVYVISTTDLSITQDTGIGLAKGVNSLALSYGNLLAGTSDGVYIKRVTDVWERVVEGNDVNVVYLNDLVMSYDTTNSFNSSPSGEAWTNKGDPTPFYANDPAATIPDLKINKAIRFRSVFFATSTGLYQDNMTFYSKGISLQKVNVTGTSTDTPSVNDIASDGEVLLVGLSDGRYYTYEVGSDSGGFFEHDASSVLETIHKVAVIDGGLWLFGFDKVLAVSQNAVVRLATGKRLKWQTSV